MGRSFHSLFPFTMAKKVVKPETIVLKQEQKAKASNEYLDKVDDGGESLRDLIGRLASQQARANAAARPAPAPKQLKVRDFS